MQVNTQMTLELHCPAASTIAALLAEQLSDVRTVVGDLAEVADACQAQALDIILDCNQHPQQSLLSAGLAPLQGPALCFVIPGKPRKQRHNSAACQSSSSGCPAFLVHPVALTALSPQLPCNITEPAVSWPDTPAGPCAVLRHPWYVPDSVMHCCSIMLVICSMISAPQQQPVEAVAVMHQLVAPLMLEITAFSHSSCEQWTRAHDVCCCRCGAGAPGAGLAADSALSIPQHSSSATKKLTAPLLLQVWCPQELAWLYTSPRLAVGVSPGRAQQHGKTRLLLL